MSLKLSTFAVIIRPEYSRSAFKLDVLSVHRTLAAAEKRASKRRGCTIVKGNYRKGDYLWRHLYLVNHPQTPWRELRRGGWPDDVLVKSFYFLCRLIDRYEFLKFAVFVLVIGFYVLVASFLWVASKDLLLRIIENW